MAKMIKVTLTKSVIGASPKQRKVVEALGLSSDVLDTCSFQYCTYG